MGMLGNSPSTSPSDCLLDPKRHTEISIDASQFGLGAILAETDPATSSKHVIAYASRSLTPVEQRYSQTEHEAIAVTWG